MKRYDIDALYMHSYREAEQTGYQQNLDVGFIKDFTEGLLVNEQHGYWSCPCLDTRDKGEDVGIVYPCDYCDADLNEYRSYSCALYVSSKTKDGVEQAESIPKRRPDGRNECAQFKPKNYRLSVSIERYHILSCVVTSVNISVQIVILLKFVNDINQKKEV